MTNYKWRPIEPLTEKDRSIDLGDVKALYTSWHDLKKRVVKNGSESLYRFQQRLIRSLSIETGILERLYDLDRGTTEALILYGFVEDLVSSGSTNIEPSLLIDILRDQEAAIQLVMDCVTNKRELTKGVLHELHAILTRHQHTTKAVDQFGNRREIPLRRGAFKQLPNNPQRPNGSIHEYSPPEQVESEVENLLAWLGDYWSEDPIVVAAWLHHRFTQIHPYQDGNGRVARALMTLVLLRADLFPIVINRDLRVDYLGALEQADGGDLAPLALLLALLEKRVILQALSVDSRTEIAYDRSITKAVIEDLAVKLSKRKLAKDEQLRKVNSVALALRAQTREIIRSNFDSLGKTIEPIGDPVIYAMEGGPDRGNSHWYKFEVVQSAKASEKWVNFSEAHYFVKATIRLANLRLVFVTSFHHIGRELSGVMEVTSFAQLEMYEEGNDRVAASEQYFPCSLEPFVITWQTKTEEISEAYKRWLDASIAVAIKEWGDRI